MTASVRLKVEQVKLEDVDPADWNPRTITHYEMEALKASLGEFGIVEPIVINADGTILGGHQRYAAALELGWPSLPAVRVDLDDKRARTLNLALNRISGDWNERALAQVLASILDDPNDPVEILTAGFTDADVRIALRALDDPLPPEAFPEPNLGTDHKCPSCSYVWAGPCQ